MVASIVVPNQVEAFSLEDYLQNPPEGMEWVGGQLVEKSGMTLSLVGFSIQATLKHFRVAVDELLG